MAERKGPPVSPEEAAEKAAWEERKARVEAGAPSRVILTKEGQRLAEEAKARKAAEQGQRVADEREMNVIVEGLAAVEDVQPAEEVMIKGKRAEHPDAGWIAQLQDPNYVKNLAVQHKNSGGNYDSIPNPKVRDALKRLSALHKNVGAPTNTPEGRAMMQIFGQEKTQILPVERSRLTPSGHEDYSDVAPIAPPAGEAARVYERAKPKPSEAPKDTRGFFRRLFGRGNG